MSSRSSIKGLVVARGDSDYEATRLSMAWNALKPARGELAAGSGA